MIFFKLFLFFFSELEYQNMPKLFTLDNYRDCLLRPGGLYCVVDIQLSAPTPNELWYQIKVSILENTNKINHLCAKL